MSKPARVTPSQGSPKPNYLIPGGGKPGSTTPAPIVHREPHSAPVKVKE
jgi:hypothetical protein